MNYLAHAYLSFNIPEILVGNMISDYVKGKKQFDYPTNIQKGIQLHRAIDAFTDAHAVTKQAKQYLYPAVGTYCGAFVDVVYDHFLAIDKMQFATNEHLQTVATSCYDILNINYNLLPEKFANMLPYMQQQNWLYNYQFLWGIEKSFEGVTWRAKYLSSYGTAFELFEKHYVALQNCYAEFFPSLKAMAVEVLEANQFILQ
ncbi:MAG: DUF479 domain-containing protein [Pedobacter sp.]|nr:DUF479 domain-containing protein [Chitinophagaceae bacterium]